MKIKDHPAIPVIVQRLTEANVNVGIAFWQPYPQPYLIALEVMMGLDMGGWAVTKVEKKTSGS